MAGQIVFNKKQGVSGRSAPQQQNSIHKHSKDFRYDWMDIPAIRLIDLHLFFCFKAH